MHTGRSLTPVDCWLILRRRKTLLVVPFLIIFSGVALWGLSLPDIYRASTLILVEAQKVPESYVHATVSAPVQERLHTITQQILSRNWLERVVRELGLLDNQQDRDALDRYISTMRRNIDVKVMGKKASGFTISYSGEEPRTLAVVANKLASLFIEENLKFREQHAIGTTDFLDRELQRVRVQLQDQEKAISEFKLQHLGELPQQQEANLRALDRLQRQLQANQETIERGQREKGLLMQHLSSLQPAGEVLPLAQQLANRRQALAQLQRLHTDAYPDVRRLKREVAELEAQLAANHSEEASTSEPDQPTTAPYGSLRWRIEQNIKDIDFREQELTRKQADIQRLIAVYEERIANTPSREQEQMVLTRDYQGTRKSYASLLGRQMQAVIAENLEKRQKAEQFRVLDPARMPTRPWKPDRGRILLMGLALGLAVGGGAVFLAEYLDHSIRDPEHLKQSTALPVLAIVPWMTTAAERHRQQLKNGLSYAVWILIPAAAITGAHFFWIKADLVFSRTLHLLNL